MQEKHPPQLHVRASELQWHCRIASYFCDHLWVILCGKGVSLSLYLPAHLFVPSTPIRCGWAVGPGVLVSDSSATASCPSAREGADAAWQGTDSLTDCSCQAWHPGALGSLSMSITDSDPSPEQWCRPCVGNVGVNWEQQFQSGWCGTGVHWWNGGCALVQERDKRERKGRSAKVTTETWYPWILAIVTYFWVFTLFFECCWQKRSKMEGLKLWGIKRNLPIIF